MTRRSDAGWRFYVTKGRWSWPAAILAAAPPATVERVKLRCLSPASRERKAIDTVLWVPTVTVDMVISADPTSVGREVAGCGQESAGEAAEVGGG